MSQVLAIWICPKRRLTFPWLRTNLMMRMINSESQKQHPRTRNSRTTDAWSQHLILIEINYIGNTSLYRMWTSSDDSSRSHTQCVCVSAELLWFLFFISPLYTRFNYCGRVDCWILGWPLKNNFIGNHHFTSHLQGVGCDLARQPESGAVVIGHFGIVWIYCTRLPTVWHGKSNLTNHNSSTQDYTRHPIFLLYWKYHGKAI
jgi:hypothetical protein